MKPVFITGIGTGVGKTLVSAIVAKAIGADYWKPVQAGFKDGTDSEWIRSVLNEDKHTVYPETYKLKLAASPHIAAREESVLINLENIKKDLETINSKLKIKKSKLVIEGAGGLMVPLTDNIFVVDLIKMLNAKLIIVSRNYLGSINHSLLTAALCREKGIDVAGWIFNDQYMQYEDEIVAWSGYPKIGSVPLTNNPDKDFVSLQASLLQGSLNTLL